MKRSALLLLLPISFCLLSGCGGTSAAVSSEKPVVKAITVEPSQTYYYDAGMLNKANSDGQGLPALSFGKTFYVNFEFPSIVNTFSIEKTVDFEIDIRNASGLKYSWRKDVNNDIKNVSVEDENNGSSIKITNLHLLAEPGTTENIKPFPFLIKSKAESNLDDRTIETEIKWTYQDDNDQPIEPASWKESTSFDKSVTTQMLDAKEEDLSLDKKTGTFTWKQIENAARYCVTLDGHEVPEDFIPPENPKYAIHRSETAGNKHTFKYYALSDSLNYRDSSTISRDFYVLNKPDVNFAKSFDETTHEEALSFNSNTIENAETYGFDIDSKNVATYSSTKPLDLKTLIYNAGVGDHTLDCYASASQSLYVDSLPSDKVSVTVLAAPEISLDSPSISWMAVPKAEKYFVYYNGVFKGATTSTSFRLVGDGGVNSKVTVKAWSSANDVLMSKESNFVFNPLV
jgi:hypothetical protein